MSRKDHSKSNIKFLNDSASYKDELSLRMWKNYKQGMIQKKKKVM